MTLLALALQLPAALDGESANQSNTALAVVSVVSMLFGYVLLALLWHFVFSKKARSKRERDPPR
ncbi:MAG: hypothetical protein ACLQBB_01890 [Solirubrobacteraceae bacterium]